MSSSVIIKKRNSDNSNNNKGQTLPRHTNNNYNIANEQNNNYDINNESESDQDDCYSKVTDGELESVNVNNFANDIQINESAKMTNVNEGRNKDNNINEDEDEDETRVPTAGSTRVNLSPPSRIAMRKLSFKEKLEEVL